MAGRACRLPRFTHCDFGLCTLVCHLVFLLCHVSKCHLHGLETCMLYILTYNGYMLHMIHETMNMNYVTWTKLICKMNIDRMYMKMTSKYMTYLYKYYVPGTATITITMQCTNTPLKCKSSTADLNKSLDNNENAHIDLNCALYEDALNCRKTKTQVGCLLNPI